MSTYHHYHFARKSGETPLRPSYASCIEHYKPHGASKVFYGMIFVYAVASVAIYFAATV